MISRNITVGTLIILMAVFPSNIYLPLLIIFLIYLVARNKGFISGKVWIIASPLILMTISGIFFANTDSSYDLFKDIWYLGKVFVVVITGFMIGCTTQFDYKWLRTTAVLASLAACHSLLPLASGGDLGLGVLNVGVLGVVLFVPFYLSGSSPRTSSEWRWVRPLVASPVLLTVVLSFSRTAAVTLVLAWLGARGIFQSKVKLTIASLVLAMIALIAIPALPAYDTSNITFLGKVRNSLDEIMYVEGSNMAEITANWRGFEAFMAYQQWQSGSVGEQIFGQGLGTPIDIEMYYPLGDEPIRYLPILHNGYYMVLVKYGVLGLFLYIIFMSSPFWIRHNECDPSSAFAKRLGVTASVVMFFTTISITGPFNISAMDGVTLLMGWSIGLQAQRTGGGRFVLRDPLTTTAFVPAPPHLHTRLEAPKG